MSTTPEQRDVLLSRLAAGETLLDITKDMGISRQGVYEELQLDQHFADMYRRARERQADAYAERIQSVAVDTLNGKYDPNAAKLMIDSLKWSASKMRPGTYGDRIQQDVSVTSLPDLLTKALDNK